MILASIDVGIKNCSICIFEVPDNTQEFKILFWDNLDLTTTLAQPPIMPCLCTKKKGELCLKPATYRNNSQYYCTTHSKQLKIPIMDKKLEVKQLHKSSLKSLKELSVSFHLDETIPKTQQIENISSYVEQHYLTTIPKVKVKVEHNLVDIGTNIISKFDAMLHKTQKSIDLVIIENQIGPLAIKMKTLQGMITQYFIMRQPGIKVEWISSTNKLREFVDSHEKLDYKQRKQKSIQICSELLTHDKSNYELFSAHKKKDDLSDCFLQGIWYLRKKIYKSS